MYRFILVLFSLIMMWICLFYVNLVGYPATPFSNDGNFVYPFKVRRQIPRISDSHYQLFKYAVEQHQSGNFDHALALYEQVRIVELTDGQQINLFAILPAIEFCNIAMARARRRP